MQNSLLRPLFQKQLIYAKQLITITFSKTAYSKQLIYLKQLITVSFQKQLIQNSLFI